MNCCNVCRKTYSTKQSLKRHQGTTQIHKNKSISCIQSYFRMNNYQILSEKLQILSENVSVLPGELKCHILSKLRPTQSRTICKYLHNTNTYTTKLKPIYEDFHISYLMKHDPTMCVSDVYKNCFNIVTKYDYIVYLRPQVCGGDNIKTMCEKLKQNI